MVVYFPPQRPATTHSFFSSKFAYEWSKEYPFVSVPYRDDDPLRRRLNVADDRHVILVCDWHQNALGRFEARPGNRVDASAIRRLLHNVPGLVRSLEEKLQRSLEIARAALTKDDHRTACLRLQRVLVYRGFAAVSRAEALVRALEADGLRRTDTAFKLTDTVKRAEALEAVVEEFPGTKAAARCQKALDEMRIDDGSARLLRGSDPIATAVPEALQLQRIETSPGSQPGLQTLDPNDRRVDRAMRAGLSFERRGRYDAALGSYALAAGLDVEDPIPLIHLGELYRHHLGRWDEARVVFQRVLELDNDDRAVAIALHGLGKMTIWSGDSDAGLAMFHQSIDRFPTALCYRNLAVYWNTEGELQRAFGYAQRAYVLDPADSYNRVFFSVYLLLNGEEKRAAKMMAETGFDISMSYNYACYHATRGERGLALKYLKKHFSEYEQYDAVRAFEMAEARMDIFFQPWFDDPRS
jgi:tetratricopeptide (TPR) repeat protein